jgi:hypothetical protein
MDDADLLLGITFMAGESMEFSGLLGQVKSWDWKGRPFILKMVGSRKRKSGQQVKQIWKRRSRLLRVKKELSLFPGWNQVKQSDLGVDLQGQALLTEGRRIHLGRLGLRIPNQTFEDSTTPINIFSVTYVDVAQKQLIGRIAPQNSLLEESAKRGLGNVGWEIQKLFEESILEESEKLKKTRVSGNTSIQGRRKVNPDADLGEGNHDIWTLDVDKRVRKMDLNPDCEDPPIKYGVGEGDWDVKKHWKELL